MLHKICIDCGDAFDVQESKAWAKQCLACWIDAKRSKEDASGEPSLYTKYKTLEISYANLLDSNTRLQNTIKQLRNQLEKTENKLPKDIKEHLPRLIQLCHPDRHQNSEASTKATIWLLHIKTTIGNP